MGATLPHGYVSFQETRKAVQHVLYAGVPDSREIARLRADPGIKVDDGQAQDNAKREIWNAVDQGKLRLMAVGGVPRRLIRLTGEISQEVPYLRQTSGFHYLRSMHRLYPQFTDWFGRDLRRVQLAFRKTDVDRLSKRLLRSRRQQNQRNGSGKKGRPSRRAEIEDAIRKSIDAGHWAAPKSVKTLTRSVSRLLSKPVSEDTVARVLDGMHENIGERRYARVRRRDRRTADDSRRQQVR